MKAVFALFSALFFSSFAYSQEPATEIRAVWLTTNWALDWPKKGKSVEDQKKELLHIFDELEKDMFNVVLFQVRAQGKVFYKSHLEGMSPFFNNGSNFDPLAFAIEAAHERNMECHAWITTFPAEKAKMSARGTVLEKKADFYKLASTNWFLDPGRPETRERLKVIVKEIVTKYDVDGLHLDYIRYPDNPKVFNDRDTYRTYGKGQEINQWRRDNVTRIVYDIYDTVKATKNWVQVSSAPVGKYKAIKKYDGWTAYESVLQDAGLWMREGKQDILFPMMYSKGNDFYPYVDEWLATSNDRYIVPGLGAYQMEPNELNWDIKEISEQMNFTRTKNVKGQAYFRVGQVLNNTKGIRNHIQNLYKHPAKLPPLTWLSEEKPEEPIQLEVIKNDKGEVTLNWQAPNKDHRYTYNIYFSNTDLLDPNWAEAILVANLHKNTYSFAASVGEYGFYYFVTASDRYHNESQPAESVFFVHSENEY